MKKCIGNIVVEDDGSRYKGEMITKENVDRFILHVRAMLSVLDPDGFLIDGYKEELSELLRIKSDKLV